MLKTLVKVFFLNGPKVSQLYLNFIKYIWRNLYWCTKNAKSDVHIYNIAIVFFLLLLFVAILLVSYLCLIFLLLTLYFLLYESCCSCLKAIAISFSFLFGIVGTAIYLWGANQKRSHEPKPMYKTDSKQEAKRHRVKTFTIKSFHSMGSNKEKSNIAIKTMKKLTI